MELPTLFLRSVFVDNILLGYFLGMCSYLAVSRRMDSALGLAAGVVVVLAITAPINWALHAYVLRPGALAWAGLPEVDLSYLGFLIYIAVIAVIAVIVQAVELVIEHVSPTLHRSLGIFLPLIAVNCAVLGTTLFVVERQYSLPQSIVFGLGSGIGWALAIISMAAIRLKLRSADVPAPLRGLGIAFIVTGLLAMAFMAFGGM
jgi:Na+-transporting NADH:ubiquinone oxidoreductase subunit E